MLVALFTTDPTVAPLLRLPVAPDATNNLSRPCSLMAEKIAAVPRAKLQRFVGRLDAARMAQVNVLVATVLGLARAPGGRSAAPAPGAPRS